MEAATAQPNVRLTRPELSFPDELAHFTSEDDFVQRMMIPLLVRLGMGVVLNYHGKSEAGMDIIVGEIDRFGHVRYHGIQVKYEASLGKAMSHALVDDAKEAYAAGFRHPQAGAPHKISSFYAVNAGSISDEARNHYFASLQPSYGDNVRLLDGRDLVALERSAAARSDTVRERLAGLLFESRSASRSLAVMLPKLKEIEAGDGNGVTYPVTRISSVASAGWLAAPPAVREVDIEVVAKFYKVATSFNTALNEGGISPIHTVQSIKIPAVKGVQLASVVSEVAEILEKQAEHALSTIGAALPV